MVIRFRHKGLERFFKTGSTSGVPAQQARRISQILGVLNACAGPEGMNLPGFKLHKLKGERKGQWAVWVSGNWRIVFSFSEEGPTDVDLVDYH